MPTSEKANVRDSLLLREQAETERARSELQAPSPNAQTRVDPDRAPREQEEGHGRDLSYSPTKTGQTTPKDKLLSGASNFSGSPGDLIGFTPWVKGPGSIVVIVPHYGATTYAELRARVKHLEAEDLRMECERLKTQVIEHQLESIEAKRRAEQADERVDELLSQHRDFLDWVKSVEATNKDIQRGLDAQRTGKPCLHDKSEGYVTRQLDDEHVAIEFEPSDGRVVEQVHHRDQFIDGKLPREGDRMEAHVLAWFHPPEPADASQYLTPEELEHGFPGFQNAIERRRKEEQADQT